MPVKEQDNSQDQKIINLALQGGGSHGAFTWGVLDAFLEDSRLDFEAISATSAGAMNAAAMAQGLSQDGKEGGRAVLEKFWRGVSDAGAFYNPFAETHNAVTKFWNLDKNPAFAQVQSMVEGMMGSVSPYLSNPMNINPLREVLEDVINIKDIHACDCLELFITATNVRTGNPTIFGNKDVTIDSLLASATLPYFAHAIEIKGQAYWDGGYMGNPSLWPLFYNAKARDILIIHVNPVTRDDIPTEIADIDNRLNEITFNSALLKELRAIDFVKRLINEDMLKDEYKDQYKDILLHAVRAEATMQHLSAASKFNTDWAFLTQLRDKGRVEGKKWLKAHFKDVGTRSSVDIQRDYLNKN